MARISTTYNRVEFLQEAQWEKSHRLAVLKGDWEVWKACWQSYLTSVYETFFIESGKNDIEKATEDLEVRGVRAELVQECVQVFGFQPAIKIYWREGGLIVSIQNRTGKAV